jgi:hypothetical protein
LDGLESKGLKGEIVLIVLSFGLPVRKNKGKQKRDRKDKGESGNETI